MASRESSSDKSRSPWCSRKVKTGYKIYTMWWRQASLRNELMRAFALTVNGVSTGVVKIKKY